MKTVLLSTRVLQSDVPDSCVFPGKELDAAKKAALKVEKKYKALLEDKARLEKEERLMPLNVDNLSKDGFQRTYLNESKPRDTSMDNLSEEEKEKLQRVRQTPLRRKIRESSWKPPLARETQDLENYQYQNLPLLLTPES